MKNSKEIASAVFQARDAYREHQQKKNRRIRKAAGISGTACAFCLTMVGVGYWNSMQTKLPAVPLDAKTEEAVQPQKCPPEESETAVRTTAPTVSMEMAEDPVITSAVSVDTQTEQEAFISEVLTETVMPISTDTSETSTASMPEHTQAPLVQTEAIPPVSESAEEQTTEEYAEVPQWDEKTICEQFMEFTAEGTVYGSKCSRIANESVGEKLYDVVVTGYDDYADEVRYADASAYRISGISAEAAVAVRFRGYDTGYVYTNRNYFPETLGELMDALNLTETISFHALTPAQGGSITEFDQSLLMNLLNDHRELPRIEDDSYHKPLFSISTSVELLGIRNKSMKITEDGWLTMNIMEVGYSFCIGEDTAGELAEAIGVNADISAETTAPYKENIEELVLE